MASHHERPGANRKVSIAALAIGLIVGFTLAEPRSYAQSAPAASLPKGLGPGTKVDHPPPPDSEGVSAPAGLKRDGTGTCRVPIRNDYDKYEWGDHVKCASHWGSHNQLVTIRNDGTQPVLLNEWYTDGWHGETALLAGKTMTLPLFGTPLYSALYVGACWEGSRGPGTCRSGPFNKTVDVEIVSWLEIPDGMNPSNYLFVRDENKTGLSARKGSSYTAINLGDYPLKVHWPELGRDRWVDLPLKGRIENIPPGEAHARKELGTGAVGLVSFAPTAREHGEDIYRLVTPTERTGVPPFAVMTLLNGSWCSVHLENLGPAVVQMQSWIAPLVPGGDALALAKGASGTLTMKRNTHLITGHVGTGSTGEFTLVKATAWKQCK